MSDRGDMSEELLSPAPGEVHLWVAMPDELRAPPLLASYERLLQEDERRRVSAFVFERHRHEGLVTRALARIVLSRYRRTPPEAWRFRRNAFGRPEIDPPCGLVFNLSNHPSMVVCAVTEGLDVGVDVEPISRGGDIVDIAETVFAPAELAALRALPTADRADRAVSLWTLKESYIKARGMGLSLPLSKFAFRFEGTAPAIAFEPPIVDDPSRWSFSTRDLRAHRIALTVASGSGPPRVDIRFLGPDASGASPGRA